LEKFWHNLSGKLFRLEKFSRNPEEITAKAVPTVRFPVGKVFVFARVDLETFPIGKVSKNIDISSEKRKREMEFLDPVVRNEYVDDIVDQESAHSESILTKSFLEAYLQIVTEGELSSHQFPISAVAVCKRLGIPTSRLRRVIDPGRCRRKSRCTGFTENLDFIFTKPVKTGIRGPLSKDILLTVNCFKEAIMRLNKQARRYFSIVEDQYRDGEGELLCETLKQLSPTERQERREKLRFLKQYPKHPSHYAYSFPSEMGGLPYFYQGVTNNPFRRLSAHAKRILPPITIHHVEQDGDIDPREEEAVEDHFLKEWSVPIPLHTLGSRSLSRCDPKTYEITHASCVKHLRELHAKVKEDLEKAGVITPPIADAPSQYPLHCLKRRQRAPNWQDKYAADYTQYPPPVSPL
jgi:hypothetical protein